MDILSIAVFLPVAGMLALAFVPKENERLLKGLTALFTGATFVVICLITLNYFHHHVGGKSTEAYAMVVAFDWIPQFKIQYFLGVDGISVTLLFLTGLLSFLATFAVQGVTKSLKGYYMMYLLLVTGMIGVFVALDFFLFYVFWEVMLLPMYFLIGIWGGERRQYAAIKFFLYTLVGSVLLLAGMLVLYFNASHLANPFSIPDLVNGDVLAPSKLGGGVMIGRLVFLAMFIGFAIKVPVFPFHTWLPDAHVQAPTAISVILAGVLLKMGGYGMIRIGFPMVPEAMRYFATALAVFGAINIVYGAFVALAQTDLKRLVAYSSVSHMGYVILGLSTLGVASEHGHTQQQALMGATLQMFNHGTISAMLFLMVGVIYERAHHRDLNRFGGLLWSMPKYGVISSIALFATLALPGFSSFIGEALTLLGSFKFHPMITLVSTLGILLTAAYVLWTVQRMFLGKAKEEHAAFPDLTGTEAFTLIPLAAVTIFLGVYPGPMIDLIDGPLARLIEVFGTGARVATGG